MGIIEASKLTKYYADIHAVDHIDFSVNEGETFGFLGPNGAGKTTTIRMLVGLTVPSEGEGRIKGYHIRKDREEIKRIIGVVPEASNLYGELSGYDNLLFLARLYGIPRKKREQVVKDRLHELDLSDVGERRFGSYSRGMKRRLVIAAALIHDPDILFLDEPTIGLDVMSAKALRRQIEQMRRSGKTIFLTTHNIAEAEGLCDRLAILVKGRIGIIDAPEDIKALLKEREMVEVVTNPPLNEVPQEFKGEEGMAEAYLAGGRLRIPSSGIEAAVRRILDYAKVEGVEVKSINTLSPSLEDAFVKLTGIDIELMKLEKPQGGRGQER